VRVRTYDEIDPGDAFRLTMTAFGWALTPKYVAHRRRRDPRLLDGFAMYAVEKGRAVAQVLPLQMPVRLATGIETVGGFQAVCSLPGVWGKGYVRELMDRAHDRFEELGIRIATLGTSRNIRGHGIYRRTGYIDLVTFDIGTRTLPPKRRSPRGVRVRKATVADLPRIQSLYKAHTRDQLGWTERDPRVLRQEVSWDPKDLAVYRIVERGRVPIGTAHPYPAMSIMSDETIAPKASDFRDAVRAIEAAETREFAAVSLISCALDRNRFEALGYRFSPMMWIMMARPLHGGPPARDLPRLFGVPQGRFVLYHADAF